MAFTNPETKEINCKVVYFGARGAGKTTNLRSLYGKTSSEMRSGLFEWENDAHQHFFECLPLSLGYVRDYHLKFNIYTLPPHRLYDSVTSVLLKGLDGYAMVYDSRVESFYDNLQCQQEVRRLLLAEGLNIAELPKVVQFNKVDLPGMVPLEVLRQELNPTQVPEISSVATQAQGTMETVQALMQGILRQLGNS